MDNRTTIHVPLNSKLYKFLKSGDRSKPKWEQLEQLIEQLPKSRAERAVKILTDAFNQVTELYPDSEPKWQLIKVYILIQILGIEMGDDGYKETEKRKLEDKTFEDLKKL